MAENRKPSIALSSHELMVTLSYLKAKDLPGLDLGKFDDLDQDAKNLVIGTAERALLAREFLTIGHNNRLELAPMIFALVGACVYPEIAFIVERSLLNDYRQEYYFYLSRKMIVMHRTPMTDIHQFVALESKDDILDNIESILNLHPTKSQLHVNGSVQRKTLRKVRDIAVKRGYTDTLKALSKTDFDEETARLLAQTLSTTFVNTTLAVIKNAGQDADGFSVIDSDEAIWIMSRSEIGKNTDADLMHLSTVSSNDVLQQVAALVG